MRLKQNLGLALTVFFACATYSAMAQTAPAASERNIPLAVGAGLSAYNPDQGHGHILGGTLWIDYTLPRMPSYLRGLGIEAEARDLNYGRSSTLDTFMREDTAMGGLFYSWPKYRSIRPYAKFAEGYGNRDAGRTPLVRYHDSRTIIGFGGGVDYQVHKNLWLRVDYEYQSWPNVFNNHGPNITHGKLNPQGFTVGALFNFSHPHFH
jgi:opacity protein-like surface antigen